MRSMIKNGLIVLLALLALCGSVRAEGITTESKGDIRFEAVLYTRYADTAFLRAEMKTVTRTADTTREKALLQQLIRENSIGSSALFPEGT